MNRIHDRMAARPDRGTRTVVRLALAALVVAVALGSKCEGKPAEFYGLIDGGAQPTTGTLNVTVVQTPGSTPISGASVSVSGPGGPLTGTTNASGVVTFTNVQAGSFTVSGTSAGSTCTSQQATVTAGQTTNVTVPCAQQVTTGTLNVTVVQTPGNTPIAGASVSVTGPGGPLTGTTNASGVATFPNVQAGQFTASATSTGRTCTSQQAAVTAGQTTSVTVPCTANPGTLVVNVVLSPANSPISGASVTATGPGGTLTGTTNASGSVTFTNVAPGQYAVSATASGVTCSPTTAAVNSGQTTTATVPCTSSPGDFTVGLNSPPPGWNHATGVPGESVECKVITTNPPRPGATFSVQASGPGVIPGQTVGGTLNASGQATFQVRINAFGTYTNIVTVTSSGVVRTGSATVNVTGSSNTCPVLPSSARFKRGVTALLPDGATLLGLRPVAFRYVEPYGDPSAPQVGLIAEEVFRVYPEAVALDAGGRPAGIWYGTLTGLVIREVESRISRAVEAGIERVTGTP